ncbi:MAG: IclR family transcriptional regulator [Devosiaceae bacterium]|nr:IclR family transcriptional regulator [Devosiaceae bacterium MH13]
MNDTAISKDRSGIQVIARAVELLRALRQSERALSLGDLAQQTNLPRSTVQRITGALLEEGLVSQDPSKRGLRLGPELARLGEAARIDIVRLCRPILESITEQTGETTDLAIYRDGSMVFVDQVAGRHRLRTVSAIGDQFPLTSTANGRAVLARMADADALQLAKAEFAADRRPFEPEAFAKLLQDIRDTHLAYDREEHTAGICAVGFAFEDALGMTYAISVPAPAARFSSALADIEETLHKARQQLLTQTAATGLK